MRRIRNFIQGGGGGSRSDGLKTVWTTLFFLFFFALFFIALNLFYSKQRESNGFITEKTIFF